MEVIAECGCRPCNLPAGEIAIASIYLSLQEVVLLPAEESTIKRLFRRSRILERWSPFICVQSWLSNRTRVGTSLSMYQAISDKAFDGESLLFTIARTCRKSAEYTVSFRGNRSGQLGKQSWHSSLYWPYVNSLELSLSHCHIRIQVQLVLEHERVDVYGEGFPDVRAR